MIINDVIKSQIREQLKGVDGFVGVAISEDSKGKYIELFWESADKIDVTKARHFLGVRIKHEIIGSIDPM